MNDIAPDDRDDTRRGPGTTPLVEELDRGVSELERILTEVRLVLLVGEKRPLLPDELARLIRSEARADRLVVGRDGQGFGGVDRLLEFPLALELGVHRRADPLLAREALELATTSSIATGADPMTEDSPLSPSGMSPAAPNGGDSHGAAHPGASLDLAS